MPAGTDLVTWNPRVGATGTDRYRWPAELPLYAGTPASFYANPDRPTLAEVNASEGWNQMVAEINRRIPPIDLEQRPGRDWPTNYPFPYASDNRENFKLGGRSPWWSGGIDIHPAVIGYDINIGSNNKWGVEEFFYVRRPASPGNSFAGLLLADRNIRFAEARSIVPPYIPSIEVATYDNVSQLRENMAIDHIVLYLLRYYKTRNTFISVGGSYLNSNGSTAVAFQKTDGLQLFPAPYPPVSVPVDSSAGFRIGQFHEGGGNVERFILYRIYLPIEVPIGMPTIASASWRARYTMRAQEERPLTIELYDTGLFDDRQEGGTPISPKPWLTGTLIATFDVGASLPPPTLLDTLHTISITNWTGAGLGMLSSPGKKTLVVASSRETSLTAPPAPSHEDPLVDFQVGTLVTSLLRCYT